MSIIAQSVGVAPPALAGTVPRAHDVTTVQDRRGSALQSAIES